MDDVAENYEGIIDERKSSEPSSQPRNEKLPGRNGVRNKSSLSQRQWMGEKPFYEQFAVDNEQGYLRQERVSSVFGCRTNRKSSSSQVCGIRSDSHGDRIKATVFNQHERRRITTFIKQRQKSVDRDENGGRNRPKYAPSAFDFQTNGKSPSHHKESSTQYILGQSRSYSRRQTCAILTAESFESPSEGFSCRYLLKHPSGRIDDTGSIGDDLRTVESCSRNDNVLNPRQQSRNWLAPCRRSTRSSYHNPNKLCSNENLPTDQQNQHNKSRALSRYLAPKIQGERFETKRGARPPYVPRRLQHLPGEKDPHSAVPEANTLQVATSPKQIEVSNIASQFQVDCCLTPVEIVTDHWRRTRPVEILQTRHKKSSKEHQPSAMEEEDLKNAEYADLLQQRPKQSAVRKICCSEQGGSCGEKQVYPSDPRTQILEDPFTSSTEEHKDNFPDDIRGPRMSMRRNAVCNEIEKETSRVKINGFRMSLHDMRVDLGEVTKSGRIRDSVLENSEVCTKGEISIKVLSRLLLYYVIITIIIIIVKLILTYFYRITLKSHYSYNVQQFKLIHFTKLIKVDKIN